MKIQVWAKTKIGKWASILTLLFIVLMAIKFSALAITIRLPFPSPFIALLGVIGFVLGIISIFKNKDRSIFVLLSIPVGLLIIFWVAAEIAFPH
jgi:membrane associated rhomboid family serine protease